MRENTEASKIFKLLGSPSAFVPLSLSVCEFCSGCTYINLNVNASVIPYLFQ